MAVVSKGRTCLRSAADRGDLETCKLLLDYPVDINAKDDYGETPLH